MKQNKGKMKKKGIHLRLLYSNSIVFFCFFFQEGKPLFDKITTCMQKLIALRGQLVFKKLSQDETRDVKSDIVSFIDWGNA